MQAASSAEISVETGRWRPPCDWKVAVEVGSSPRTRPDHDPGREALQSAPATGRVSGPCITHCCQTSDHHSQIQTGLLRSSWLCLEAPV